MRSSLLEVMDEDFVQTARAKGVRDKDVRRRHAVPNALLPTFTLAFYSVDFILGGASSSSRSSRTRDSGSSRTRDRPGRTTR